VDETLQYSPDPEALAPPPLDDEPHPAAEATAVQRPAVNTKRSV
jgi:hypothetical protein